MAKISLQTPSSDTTAYPFAKRSPSWPRMPNSHCPQRRSQLMEPLISRSAR